MPRATVTSDHFGCTYLGGELCPHECKELGRAFAHRTAHRGWVCFVPGQGYTVYGTGALEEAGAREVAYCYNHDC